MANTTIAPIAVSIAEAATALGISERHARNLAHDGEIPTIALGGRAVVPVRWLEERVDEALRTWAARQGSGS
jgi:excisionase family DNA binding protein